MPRRASTQLLCCLITFVFALYSISTMQAQTFSVLYSFGAPADGYNPSGGVVFDSAGNLYGPTSSGGTGRACGDSGCGTVFQLINNSNGRWSEKVIHSFDGTDGAHPGNPLIFGDHGVLYGTAACDLTYCYYEGTVFELIPHSDGTWAESTLHTFPAFPLDGGSPQALVLDSAGNLYGEADSGGVNNTGLIFELNQANGWRESLLYVFGPFQQGDGSSPSGAFSRDADGNLYGTTYVGGAYSQGIAFELTNDGRVPFWRKTVLYTFPTNFSTRPNGVSFGPDGSLYGTTEGGGINGKGSIFRLTRNPDGTWSETDLYSFLGGSDGSSPFGGVAFDNSGNLYGTTVLGGGNGCDDLGCGTVYRLTQLPGGGWLESILYRFSGGLDGANPVGTLVLDGNNNLFGVADIGGPHGNEGGVVFEITP